MPAIRLAVRTDIRICDPATGIRRSGLYITYKNHKESYDPIIFSKDELAKTGITARRMAFRFALVTNTLLFAAK